MIRLVLNTITTYDNKIRSVKDPINDMTAHMDKFINDLQKDVKLVIALRPSKKKKLKEKSLIRRDSLVNILMHIDGHSHIHKLSSCRNETIDDCLMD